MLDFKNVTKRVTKGDSEPIRNYTAQGYINFGASSAAAVRDAVTALEDGVYTSVFATVLRRLQSIP